MLHLLLYADQILESLQSEYDESLATRYWALTCYIIDI